jgi:hypothetical protein
MLAHSPPLPLVIDYDEYRDNTTEEEGIIFALGKRDRVRRVRLHMPFPNLQKIIKAIDKEYPILEYLIMWPSTADNIAGLMFPETFQAPHLRHLMLFGFTLPIGSRLLTTAVGIVTLCLFMGHPSYFQPNTLLQGISFMPQLETLLISFVSPIADLDAESQLTHVPIMTQVTLPNLRSFGFRGVSAYMEAVVRRITAPRLEKLCIHFLKQLTFHVPRLLQFMNTAENLRFDSANFQFSNDVVYVDVFPPNEAEMYALRMAVHCYHLDWQVFSVAQIFDSLGQKVATVEHLTFVQEAHSQLFEEHNEDGRSNWRKLFGSFGNVKTLRVDDGLVKEISRSLDGELPLEVLPELQELRYFGSGDTGDVFTSFINSRHNAGRPVTLIRP